MRVTQNSTFLLDVLKSVKNGAVGLPTFQREYCWTKSDVEDLMKSVMRGWPIGSFTMWEPANAEGMEFIGKGRLGPVETNDKSSALLLDGQNRLASIMYAAFMGDVYPTTESGEAWQPSHPLSQGEIDTWFSGEILAVNLLDKSISFVPEDQAWSAHSVPLGDALNAFILRRGTTQSFFRKSEAYGWPDEYLSFCGDELFAKFIDARVTVTQLLNASVDEALECYLTICKAGQPISATEFQSAVHFREQASNVSNSQKKNP